MEMPKRQKRDGKNFVAGCEQVGTMHCMRKGALRFLSALRVFAVECQFFLFQIGGRVLGEADGRSPQRHEERKGKPQKQGTQGGKAGTQKAD